MRYGWGFRTKRELAADMVDKFSSCPKRLGKRLRIVAAGPYAKREFLIGTKAAGATVVSRLRRDAALYSVPTPPPSEQGTGTDRGSMRRADQLGERWNAKYTGIPISIAPRAYEDASTRV